MNEIKKIARAKINLGLDVLSKREDGYHEVKMIMQTINLHDKLRLKKIRADKVILETNLPFLPTDDRNLVVKIIKHMIDTYKIESGVFVDLYKVIPVGAGLAGGSTDAASTITGMNDLFELGLSLEEMLEIGGQFGADIPYCLIGGTALAEGIGEKLTSLSPVPKLHMLVAKPKVSVSTAYVYENLGLENGIDHPDIDGMVSAINNKDVQGIVSRLGNVLEDVTIRGYKEVEMTKEAILNTGAMGALMTGSGSAVFGIYETEDLVKQAGKVLKKNDHIRYVYETSTYN